MKKILLLCIICIFASCTKVDDDPPVQQTGVTTTPTSGKLSYKITLPHKLGLNESVRFLHQVFYKDSIFYTDSTFVKQNDNVGYNIWYASGFDTCDKVFVEAIYNNKVIRTDILLMGFKCTPPTNMINKTFIIP